MKAPLRNLALFSGSGDLVSIVIIHVHVYTEKDLVDLKRDSMNGFRE